MLLTGASWQAASNTPGILNYLWICLAQGGGRRQGWRLRRAACTAAAGRGRQRLCKASIHYVVQGAVQSQVHPREVELDKLEDQGAGRTGSEAEQQAQLHAAGGEQLSPTGAAGGTVGLAVPVPLGAYLQGLCPPGREPCSRHRAPPHSAAFIQF